MANADSVKAKLRGLIDVANAATGKTDTDLTAAIGTLVDGFGGGSADAYIAMLNGSDIPSDGGTLRIPEGVTRVINSFYNAKMLSVSNVTVIFPTGLKTIGANAFRYLGYSKSAHAILNDDLEEIGQGGFLQSMHLNYNKIPSGLKVIGVQAFLNGSSNATDGPYTADLDFPNIESIDNQAFKGFNFAGGNVHLGSKITSIGSDAFAFKGSPSFTLVIDRAEDAVSGAPWGATNATIVWTGGDA